MPKQLFVLLCVAVLAITGCKKKLTQFYVDYHAETVVQSTFGTLVPFSVQTPEVVTNSTYEFENNDTRKDHIRSIYLKTLILTITSPSSETFSFVNDVKIYIDSPNNSETLVASRTAIPDSVGNTLTFSVPETDLQGYIKDDKFSIRLEVTTDETISQDVHIDIYSNFLVDAKLIRGK